MLTSNSLKTRVVPALLVAALCVGIGNRPVLAQNASSFQVPEDMTEGGALGASAASDLFATYAAISSALAAYEKGAFTAEQVQQMMAMFDRLAAFKTEVLRKLLSNPNVSITSEDRAAYDKLINFYKVIGDTARSMSRYSETNSIADRAVTKNHLTTLWGDLAIMGGNPGAPPLWV